MSRSAVHLGASFFRRGDRLVVRTHTALISVPIHRVAFQHDPEREKLLLHSNHVCPPLAILDKVCTMTNYTLLAAPATSSAGRTRWIFVKRESDSHFGQPTHH